ncbi:MAG: tRNA (adenosine(37)-N6)-threonylcarbamoyltransferase complex dimerization subunit type 1 TsaB [Zymomonas mobilis]|uniref:tRNA threonylcarbamoyl adenosine modification protein YeaZ n=1 Tax=Zymomonas mobilis TaxID=542 RepID=A0A542W2D1_ZYMMB|nr:tRNA (adenosine(37)-N6)-threonylcarbamoyltransferase complex dimerization subunit type 1 TsaB [Zymomonas mobilis]TQL17745.1 tRNA threonylcarbamoyl adenosine modification protein YeaZ [Zymomonas mobilis]
MQLVIDTATAACSVALIKGDHIIACEKEIVGRGHAEKLLPMIAALPDQGRADKIIVDCGPGSFTGIRVGIAAALALGLGWDVPVSGYGALDVVAAAAFRRHFNASNLTVAFIGGHGEIFIQSFSCDRPSLHLTALTPIQSLRPEDAAPLVKDSLIAGSAAATLVKARGWGESEEAWPFADEARFLAKTATTLPATPIYGRLPDAKIPA